MTFLLVIPCILTAQQFKPELSFSQELWVTRHQGFQNRALGLAGASVDIPAVEVNIWMEYIWWGNDNSLIPGSFLNAESGKVLERNYGATLLGKFAGCFAGARAARRSFLTLGEPVKWGSTIGYYDDLRAEVGCDLPYVRFSYISPKIVRWNDATMPYPDHIVNVALKYGKLVISSNMELEGTQQNSYDFGIGYHITPNVYFGANGGSLSYPGFGNPIERGGITINLHF